MKKKIEAGELVERGKKNQVTILIQAKKKGDKGGSPREVSRNGGGLGA